MRRILYIKPTAYDTVNDATKRYLERYRGAGTEIEVANIPKGPRHLEGPAYEVIAAPEILKLVLRAEREGFDGAIIGCFKDTVLHAAREVCERLCVTAPGESSMLLASTLGHTFSILVGRRKWIPEMKDNALRCGLAGRLASFRSLGLGVLELHADEAATARAMRREIKAALEQDGAETIILGCTMSFGFFEDLQREFKVPVIDPMLAALKQLELMIEVKEKMGWYSSKIGGFSPPDPKEVAAWGIEKDFGMQGLWPTGGN